MAPRTSGPRRRLVYTGGAELTLGHTHWPWRSSTGSDRDPTVGLGSPYASDDYRKALSKYAMVASMCRKGDCWDNAVAESFFATAFYSVVDATCSATDDYAASGNVALTAADSATISRHLDLAFPNGDTLTGTFSAPVCPVVTRPMRRNPGMPGADTLPGKLRRRAERSMTR